MRVAVANGLGHTALRGCLEVLLVTAGETKLDLHVIHERASREATWNEALDRAGRDHDLLLLGDDVLLTPGWVDALHRGAEQAEIVGLSTLQPGTELIQDRGYDLVRVDGRVTVEARDRGLSRRAVEPFGVRPCDAVCGCLLYVKAEVLRSVPSFREEGMNRWGEFVFAREAQRAGARIAVVDHFVYHHGSGTKSNPDPKLRSTSAQLEREPWERIVERWVDPAEVRAERQSELDPELLARLRDPGQRILFYGIGTVSEALLRHAEPDRERIAFCSGLPEEVGLDFYGHTVLSVSEAPLHLFDQVLITPLYRGEKIARQWFSPRLPGACRLAWIERRSDGDRDRLWARDAQPPLD